MLKNIKKNKIKLIAILIILLIVSLFVLIKIDNKNDNVQVAESINDMDINDDTNYSEEFMENYFEEISKYNSDEEKENMLIVISHSKIENTYGAKNIIEAPNNQYILQYESTEKKDEALIALKEDNSISSVEENIIYTIEDTGYNSWGVEKMALDHAIETSRIEILSDITVAIIDTGCDTSLFHKYYSGKMVETYNVLEDSTTSSSMVDEDGHGTHVAGTIAEATPLNVKILPIKVSKDGGMYNTDIIAAINYITYNEKANVINMSFGGYSYSKAMEDAINAANNKNIICVAAAGNNNTSKNHYPSAFDKTISIASVNSNLTKSKFSNYGSSITFTAPGTNIKSIMGGNTRISRDNIRSGYDDGDDDHETISGTSMAAPHAASAVAILKSYNKNLTLEDVIELLKKTAVDLGEQGWDEYFGYGMISFNGVEFRDDNENKDEYGVYKNIFKNIINIELTELKFTPYNYYSLTNIMASRIKVYYSDNTNEEMSLWELPYLEVLNYIPTEENEQKITIKTGNISIDVDITNPSNYESGWEYSWINQFDIKITGYKSHGFNIGRLYVPEEIDSKNVKAFEDNLEFSKLGNDFSYYDYLYLPSNFKRIGDYSLSNTNIKYIYGDSQEVEIGNHGFESSSIVIVDVPIIEVGDYAFKDCFELINIDIPGKFSGTSASNTEVAKTSIGDYAFYNCKKLIQIKKSKYDTVSAEKIGKYAFYNCISLAKLEMEPSRDIGEYAFYNCITLSGIKLYNVDSIGIYSFYSSGISEAELGLVDEVKESAFENCRNLKSVSFTSGNIETRAFWNSAVEEITISSMVDYIAEDAFAYCPVKNCNGGSTSGNYYCMFNEGIIEKATNKLIVGFTGSDNYGNTQIPNSVTEIGNYAFTGNNTVKTIIIPESVTRIGDYAFKDCYQLSSVYMLGNNIEFGNDTFVRTYEGEIQNSELFIYLHKDNSNIRQYIKSKNLEYRNIEPDEIIVIDNKGVYRAFDKVDEESLTVKLIYHEENNREEILSKMNYSTRTVLTNKWGVGFQWSSGTINYGDTYYTLEIRNIHGFEERQKVVEIEVIKAIPKYKIPTNLTGNLGQKLSEIALPNGFEWMNGNEIINEAGDVIRKARYTPSDITNYEIVENIDITISVENTKTVINPNISLENKTYDGTTQINTSDITVSNLNNSEYSIVSAILSSADIGERTATIKLRLSDEKYEEYSFDNGKQEKEFEVEVNVLPLELIKPTLVEKEYVYNGNEQTIQLNNFVTDKMNISGNKRTNAGEQSTTISLKNNNYIWNDGTRNNIEFNFKINKADSNIKYSASNMIYKYDEQFYGIELNLESPSNAIIKYADENDEYILDEMPKYNEIGTYTIKYRIYINDNYTDIFGENTLAIVENYVIGDINGDGKVNIKDWNTLYNHINETEQLTGYQLLCADINGDGKVNIKDWNRMYDHITEVNPLW